MNADSVVDTEDLLGGNLFAYCGNSPVARRDTTGQFWDTVFDIVSLCISVKNVISNPKSGSAWLGLAADVLCLAIHGLTGGGSAVRAAKTVKNAVAVAKKRMIFLMLHDLQEPHLKLAMRISLAAV